MASYYVYSGAGGAGTGADWANAYTTLNAAFAGKAAGDIFYIADDHAETTAGAVALTSPGTKASPCLIYCALRTGGSVPPVAADLRTTATISNTTATDITLQGVAYMYGVSLNMSNSTSGGKLILSTSTTDWTIEAGTLYIRGSGATGAIYLNLSAADLSIRLRLVNTKVKFAAAGQRIYVNGGTFEWFNTAAALDVSVATPATLITYLATTGRVGSVMLRGLDLSNLGANTLIGAVPNFLRTRIIDCKLHASTTKIGTITQANQDLIVTRCASTAGNYIEEKHSYEGSQVMESTIIRTGGYTFNGTGYAWNITTTNAEKEMPFECLPMVVWNTSTASLTVTVYGIWGGGAVPNDDEIWLECEYLGDAGTPVATTISDGRATPLTAGAGQASDTSTWGGSTTKFKLSCTFTPAQAGSIICRVKVGKTGANTFYIDPKPVIS